MKKVSDFKLQFSLEPDNFKLLENDGYCSIAEIDFLHTGLNRNRCNITEECVEKSLKSFYNKPLLCILDNSIIPSLSTDFKEHAYTEEEKKKFIAFGTIPESSEFRYIERTNGKTYLNAKVVIWKNYFPIIMDILNNREGNVKVSIELAVIDGEQDEETGILNINEFRLLSCVLLGEGIMEGIEGSHMEVLRFSLSEEDFKLANEYYTKFSNKENYYEIPSEVSNAIKKALDSYRNKGRGCTTQELTMAQKMSNLRFIGKIELDKIKEKIDNSKGSEFSSLYNVLGGELTEKWINNIKKERVGDTLVNSLSNNEIAERIYNELGKYRYHDGDWEGRKYYVEEIYADEKVAIVRDNETAKLYKIPYSVKGDKVTVEETNKKEVHRTYEELNKEETFSAKDIAIFAKEDYGKEGSIKVDKSKEAMSDTSWGSINKTELRKKVLNAKNYKSLVKDVYLDVEEGWEDAPSTKLKYPVMEIKDGKAVYNRYGLASALAYAQANNETAIVEKVKSLYSKLDIDNEDEGGEKKMAKESDKKEEKEVVENKLDKENKDIEKIKDDADAQEDDVKEEKDDKGEEGLEDDVDADKDYWKKKANALEKENTEIKNELMKYKREKEEIAMAEEIDKFAHCMSEEEVNELKNSIKEMSMDEMKEKINSKIADFALKVKEEKEKEIKYSFNPLFEIKAEKFSKEEIDGLDSIISNSNVKIVNK